MGTTTDMASGNQQETVIETALLRLDSFEHRLDDLTSRLRSVNHRIGRPFPPECADSVPTPDPIGAVARLSDVLYRLDVLAGALHEEIIEVEKFV